MQYVSVRLNLRPEVQPLFTSNSQLEKDNIPPTTTSLYSVMFPSASLTTFHRYFGAKSLKISKVFQVKTPNSPKRRCGFIVRENQGLIISANQLAVLKLACNQAFLLALKCGLGKVPKNGKNIRHKLPGKFSDEGPGLR